MAKQRPAEEETGGCPEWMVTFCDCMTLLLTFFVLLLSFATFHKETLPKLGRCFTQAMPTLSLKAGKQDDAMFQRREMQDQSRQTQGSETPTQVQRETKNFMREKKPLDFKNLKVFTVPSSEFFFGQGAALTPEAKKALDALATYLNSQTGRIVISENGPDSQISIGLQRAMTIMNYLIDKNVKKDRMNISIQTTLKTSPTQRQIEITLLDKSVYE